MANEQAKLVTRVYNWQEQQGIYGWHAKDLKKDLGIHISEFVLSENGVKVEFKPDEKAPYRASAYGYRLIRIEGGLYGIEKHPNPVNTEPSITEQTAQQMAQLREGWAEENEIDKQNTAEE